MHGDAPTILPDGLALPAECPAPAALAPPPPIPRAAWAMAGLALAVRIAAALLDPVPPRDGIALAETVRPWLAPAGIDPVAALAIVAVICGAAAALPLHDLARRMFEEDAANGAVLLYAVTPPLVRIGSRAYAEPVLFLLGLLSLVAAVRALRHWRPLRDAAIAGLWAGAATLVRPEGWALLPIALLAPLAPGGSRPWRHRLAGFAAALAGFAAVAGPGALLRHGDLLSGKSLSVLAGTAPPADPGGAAPAERHSLPAAVLQATGALPEAMHPWPAILAALGIVAAAVGFRRCGKASGPMLLGLGASLLFLGGVVLLEWRYGYGGRRHASMAGLLLLPFAGRGTLAAAGLLRRARPVVALGLVGLLPAAALAAGALLDRDVAGSEARALGLGLRGAPAPRVATFGEPRVGWYAGGTDVRLLREYGVPPGAPPGDSERRAAALLWFLRREDGPGYLVIREGDARVPAEFRPDAFGPPIGKEGSLRLYRLR